MTPRFSPHFSLVPDGSVFSRSAKEGGTVSISDHISDQLRAQAADLRNSITAQARSMLPGWPGPSTEQVAAWRAERKAVGAQRIAAATAEWEAVRAQLRPDTGLSAVLLAVLDLHKPYLTDGADTPDCGHCCTGAYDVESTPWACETFETIRDGLKGQDGRHD